MLIWGARDPIIPLERGRRAHKLMPHSRLEVFPGAGHFPFNDDPERFVEILNHLHRRPTSAENGSRPSYAAAGCRQGADAHCPSWAFR